LEILASFGGCAVVADWIHKIQVQILLLSTEITSPHLEGYHQMRC